MEAALNGPTGRIVLQDPVLSIGRVPGNQLVVTDAKASSHHAEIRQEGQAYTITDLKSTNGTFVNEQALQPQTPRPLQAGDVIRIGDTRYTFEVIGASALDATIYAAPGLDMPRYEPTVMAPPPTPFGANDPQNAPNMGAAGYPYAPPPPPIGQPYVAPQQGAVPNNPYSQPGYTPGMMMPPPSQMPPPKPKRSYRGLFIGLGLILVALVIVCSILGYVLTRASGASATLDTFCTALKAKDYNTVYQQFSTKSALRSGPGKISQDQFVPIFAQALNAHGGVTSCTVSNVNENGSSATGTVDYVYGDKTTERDNITLSNDDVGWRLLTLKPQSV
ncbi:MAG TPA: FHA domain-containing protein [Ktedonobacteraceae bacterium]|nr:FHA domain-containing protein [Ktedonobacteraceae bacterium]